MANDFYTETGSPSTGSSGSSATIRAEFVAIRAAFDKMMGLAGNGGLPAFVNAGGTALEAANIATAQTRLGIVVSNELNGLANLNAVGLIARTGNGTYASRTLTAPAAGIAVANGNGVSGNPTLSLTNDLNALEALNNNGIAVRTGDDTWAARTIVGTANQVTVANGNGVAGNQTISLPNPMNITDLGVTNVNATGTIAVAGNISANNVNIVGALRGTSAMLSPLNGALASVVTLNTTNFIDVACVVQGANGTWFAVGTATVNSGNALATLSAKLWDGNNTIAGSSFTWNSGGGLSATISLQGFISNPTGNIRLSVKDNGPSNSNVQFNTTGTGRDTTVSAFRIG